MSANFVTHQLGATTLHVGTGVVPIQFAPQPKQIGWRLKLLSGGSSGVVFMQGAGASLINTGYVLDSDGLTINGPARFYLSAFGSTAVVSALVMYGQGYSSYP